MCVIQSIVFLFACIITRSRSRTCVYNYIYVSIKSFNWSTYYIPCICTVSVFPSPLSVCIYLFIFDLLKWKFNSTNKNHVTNQSIESKEQRTSAIGYIDFCIDGENHWSLFRITNQIKSIFFNFIVLTCKLIFHVGN